MTLRVQPGAIAQQDFGLALAGARPHGGSEVIQLEKFEVAAKALSVQAAALNEQRVAPNIKNVVVFEEYGDLADGNIGEYLKYTPGLSMVNGPQVPLSVSVRGMPASGTLVMVDGAEVSSPAADRAFDLTTSMAGNVDRIEVTKAPTPDMPANAVGGSINIVGKSGFSSPRRSVKLNLFSTFNYFDDFELSKVTDRTGSDRDTNLRRIQPGFNLSWLQPVNNAFAFTVNIGASTRFYDLEYLLPGWDLVRLVQTTVRQNVAVQVLDQQQAAVTLDWKVNPDHSLRLNVQHTRSFWNTRQHDHRVIFGANATGGPTFTQGAAAGGDTFRQGPSWSNRVKLSSIASLQYRHAGPVWKWDANATYSESGDEFKDIEDGFFGSVAITGPTTLIMRAEGFDGIYDRRAPVLSARDRAGAVVDPYGIRDLSVNSVSSGAREVKADMRQFNVNIGREFQTGFPLSLKTGIAVNTQQKEQLSYSTGWTFTPPGGAGGRLAQNFDFVNPTFSTRSFYDDSFKVEWLSPVKVYDLYRAHPEYFVGNEASDYTARANASKNLKETISAAYLRGDAKFFGNRLSLVTGVRFERTEDHGVGPRNDIRATYQQDANGNLLRDAAGRLIPVTTDPLARARLQIVPRGAAATKTYDGYYPSLNASFGFTDAIIGRVAYARTIGRPPLTEIIPGMTITDPDSAVANRTISVTNTGLSPWTSNNYDLSLEAYHLRGAVISGAVFRKEVTNFFGQTRGPATAEQLVDFGLSDDYLGYEIITKRNFGSASIQGIELSWRQSLYFLPSWAKGFEVFANLTRMRLAGPNALDFTPFSRENFNWGVSYARKNLSVKLNVAHSDIVTGAREAPSASVPVDTFGYVAPQTTADLFFDYRFYRRLSLYGSVRNLTASPKRTLRSAPDTPAYANINQYQYFGTLVTVGVKAEF